MAQRKLECVDYVKTQILFHATYFLVLTVTKDYNLNTLETITLKFMLNGENLECLNDGVLTAKICRYVKHILNYQ